MNTEVAAARLRMMRVANTALAYKNQQAAPSGPVSFQQTLQKNSSSTAAAEAGLGGPQASAGANVQDLMRSESYRTLVPNPADATAYTAGTADTTAYTAGTADEVNAISALDTTDAPAAAASPGGKSSVPRAEDFQSLEDLVAAFGGISDNPINAEDWRSSKPERWSEEGFQRKINETNYKYSLLDPDNLPYGLTRPVEGKSSSTDIIETRFVECNGGIQRIDLYSTGDREHHTFIPVMEWEHVTSGGGRDPQLGDVYKMQTPFGFKVTFMRGSSGTPSGYEADRYQDKLNSLLAEG